MLSSDFFNLSSFDFSLFSLLLSSFRTAAIEKFALGLSDAQLLELAIIMEDLATHSFAAQDALAAVEAVIDKRAPDFWTI